MMAKETAGTVESNPPFLIYEPMANVIGGYDPSSESFVKTPPKLAQLVSPTAAIVYLGFADHVNNKKRDTIVAASTVAKEIGISLASVNRGLKELADAGLMETEQRGYKQSARRVFYLQPRPPKTKDAVSNEQDAVSVETRQLDSLSNYTLEPGDDPIADTFISYEPQPCGQFHGNAPAVTGWTFAYRNGGMFRKAA